MQRYRLLLVLLLVAAFTGSRASAADGDGTAEDTARLIAQARDRANDAAQAWADAQSKLELLADQIVKIDEEIIELEERVAELKTFVEAAAVNRYIGAGSTGVDLLAGNIGPTEQAQMEMLVGLINDTSATTFDDYAALVTRLDRRRADAEATTREYEAAQDEYRKREQEALAEVERLKLIEKDRLTDEAVQRALEAERQKAVEEQQRIAAEQLQTDQAAAELLMQGSGSDGGDLGQGVVTGNPVSGGSAGGTTGGGGSGGRAVGFFGAIYGRGEAWTCPIPGGSAFADTWGEPRSGGRSHQGVDMIANRGTEIVAVVDGIVMPHTNVLGGQVLWLSGFDGNRYYYAHLDGYANLGEVVKGMVIGYVGDSGNAIFSTPHLHFEIHPGGGAAVNPYPTVLANC